METPQCSIIIPTYNRVHILAQTLEALLERQEGAVPPWELLVVDDGSTDATPELLRELAVVHGSKLKVFRQKNLKQGAARNTAMKRAKGALFVFLGDDIIPGPTFLLRHWKMFEDLGRPKRHATIGRTLWHPDIAPSPFRHWINEWGPQFGFQLIQDTQNVPFNFFYTSNLSFSRDLYDDFGGFDESFQEYGWEDIELGYRYAQLGGMRLRYDPLALAYHNHRITIRSFCDRQRRVGFSAVRFARKYPELRRFLHLHDWVPHLGWIGLIGAPLGWALEWCDEHLGWIPLRLTELLMKGCYAEGVAVALRREKLKGEKGL